ncbi:hypothetical protein [Saccharopolyspora thermophila]|uniref:hypothetical protein n=1 Tax=Saccharopolyspora thermophila TaxID=89367 RepID=UPI0016642243|nr:hypothetical protein [Saccharopolyspora subtropica]
MLTSVRLFGVAAAAAATMAIGSPAFADSYDNDGINIANDNNVSLAPVQVTGTNAAVLGATGPGWWWPGYYAATPGYYHTLPAPAAGSTTAINAPIIES